MKRKQIAIFLIISLLMQMLVNIILPIQSIAADTNVTIECKDINFYKALISQLQQKEIEITGSDDSNKTITMTKENVDSVTKLILLSNGIADITGIEKFTNLESLELNNNKIKDIRLLENLTNLEYLDLDNNKIKDIEPLRNLNNLKELMLSRNQIEDISPVSEKTQLEKFTIDENKISFYIQKDYGEVSEIELPQIMQETMKPSSQVYTEKGLALVNCSFKDDNKNAIIVDRAVGDDATVMVDGGAADKAILRIKMVDDKNPELTVKKTTEELTNQPVTVTITSDKELKDDEDGDGWSQQGWEFQDENHKVLQKTYEENTAQAEKVEVYDFIGNKGSTDIEILNIDTEKPNLEVSYDPPGTSVVNAVTVTIKADEEIQEIDGWTRLDDKETLTKTYEENVKETITVFDLAGNKAEANVSIENIGAKGPSLDVTYSPGQFSKSPITVTIRSRSGEEIYTDDTDWASGESGKILTRTFEEEGVHDFDIVVKNRDGGVTTLGAKCVIDKTPPLVYDERQFSERRWGRYRTVICERYFGIFNCGT